jgi:Cu/Zn superoxide dismutase
VKRITKAALGGIAGCALILGATQAAIGESKFITYQWGPKVLADLRPEVSGGPLDGASASLRILETPDEGTGFRLRVTDINTAVANKEFGAHLHVGPCNERIIVSTEPTVVSADTTAAHYKHGVGQASPLNEVWFNLAPDEGGVANDETWVSFDISDVTDPGGVMSVVLHRDPTDPTTQTGVAGPREACLPVVVPDWAAVGLVSN